MSKIKMKATTPGSPDGMSVKKYIENAVYDIPNGIPESLAGAFVGAGFAEYVSPQPTQQAVVAPPEVKEPEEVEPEKVEDVKEVDKEESKDDEKEEKVESKNTSVSDLAKELKVTSKDVTTAAKALKISATHPRSGLTGQEADEITAELKKD